MAFSNGAASSPLLNGIEVLSSGTAIQQINCGELAGGTINVNSSNLLNRDTLQVSNGETLNLSGAWSNTGTIAATAATLNLGGSFTTAGLGTVNGSGGTVNLTGTLNNAGSTLTLGPASGSWNLVGGTISGGTLSETGGAELVATSSGGTLSGVTVSGPLDLTGVTTGNSPSLTVTNGLTLNNATVLLGNAAGTTYGQMFFNTSETLGGTGTVLLGKHSSDGLFVNSSCILTLGSGITVRGSDGYLDSSNPWTGTIVIQGTILADDSGGLVGNFVYDQSYSGGSNYSTADVIDTSGVSNPAPQAVWQTCRAASSFSYNVSGLTAGASYTVALDFSDSWATAAGQRVFDVSINGTQVLTNFDIIATAGKKDKALQEIFTATANGSGQIAVAFNSVSGDGPLVNGIEVLSGGVAVQQINCGELAGGTINVDSSNFLNQGALQALGGILAVSSSITLNGTANLNSDSGGTITVGGNLTGNTQQPSLFTPAGTLVMNGSGTASSPQLLEVMSEDLGDLNVQHDFPYGTLSLANNTYVKLVDQYRNSPGTAPEASMSTR